tara:strand:- start:264 stop:515 length:252 start_codon:yes stop_codon:yes gene_type:complete
MTMIKGNQDGVPTLDNVDLTHAKTLECEKCKCKAFKQSLMLKKLSALVSPTGKEALIPVAVFVCEQCGHINKEFEEAEIQQAG